MWALIIAAGCAGLFAGAAIYINAVEHPARVSCGSELALREFVPSYRRGTVMQASLATVGCAIGLWSAWLLDDGWVLLAAVLLGTVVPFTLMVILPTNKRLLDPLLDPGGDTAGAAATMGSTPRRSECFEQHGLPPVPASVDCALTCPGRDQCIPRPDRLRSRRNARAVTISGDAGEAERLCGACHADASGSTRRPIRRSDRGACRRAPGSAVRRRAYPGWWWCRGPDDREGSVPRLFSDATVRTPSCYATTSPRAWRARRAGCSGTTKPACSAWARDTDSRTPGLDPNRVLHSLTPG